MTKEELRNLERLMNYMAHQMLRKTKWEDVSKIEWANVSDELNALLKRQQKAKKVITNTPQFGANYFYEHLVLKKLKHWKAKKNIAIISSPNFSKLNQISLALGYTNYIDFINNATEGFSFHELKINVPLAPINEALLDHLIGFWYCYNRNLPYQDKQQSEERIWRSAMEIYKSGDEYLVERTGKDNHMYYGKITSYAEYVFIIMNSTTFIRQRHFIGRLKDVAHNIKQKGFSVDHINFVSTCVSFNEEPIALYEIFDRVPHIRQYEKKSIDLPINSEQVPEHIKLHLKDAVLNRITEH